MSRLLLIPLVLLAACACAETAVLPSATPSSSEEAPAATASPAPDASASSDGRATILSTASPTPFITPAPELDRAPRIPVGRALSVQGEIPAQGMVRLDGSVLTATKAPAAGICVTLGPPIACAVLTDSHGKWVIDVPQGKFTWELHFVSGGTEVGPKVMIDGPFRANTVSVETVTVK